MELNLYKNIIDQISPYSTTVLLHFQGEPLLSTNLVNMVQYATSKRLITEIATNATLLTYPLASNLVDAGVKKIVVTLDSTNEHDFGFYRKGANFKNVVSGVSNLIRARELGKKKYPMVVLELLAFKRSLDDIDRFIALGKQLRVDKLRIKSVQVTSGKDAYNEIPINTRYSRYKINVNQTITLKSNINKPCPNPWFKFSVYYDGSMVPCCFDKSGDHILGNAQDVRNAWISRKYNDFRKKLLANRNAIPLCSQCPQGRFKLDFKVD